MGHLVITNVPIGGIDTDSEDASVEAIDCRDAVNIRNSYTYLNIEKTAGPVKGNVLVSYDLGNVKHKSLGTVEDKIGKSIIYFLWAEDNNHKILRYFIEKIENGQPYGTIENVITFDFGWTRHTSIHSADVVKGELLYWIDPVPRKINMTKAGLAFKQKSWTITLPTSYTVLPASFPITVKDYYTNANIAMITAYTTIGQTIKQAFESLANQINTGAISSYLEAETCGCTLQIKEKTADKYKFVWSATDYKVVADNWYGPNLKARYFDAAKWQPACQPNYEYAQDATKKYNLVKNHVWQFRTAYYYDDAETSVMSPISQIAVNNEVCNDVLRNNFNTCVVDFNNDDAIDPDMWVIIKKIILYVHDRNAGVWRKVISLEPCEFYDVVNGVPKAKYVFDNLLLTQSVSESYAALLYDRMPREADAQKFIEDHIVYGAPLDDYDAPDCAEIETNITYREVQKPEYYDATFKIRICNPAFDGSSKNGAGIGKMPYMVGFSSQFNNSVMLRTNKRGCVVRNENEEYATWGGASKDNVSTNQTGWDQWLPLGGFLLYSAGTPFWAISKQKQEGGLQTDENGAFLTAGSKKDDIKNYLARFNTDPLTGDVYQTVTIRLPKGKHIIRIASHLVSDGDVLKRGEVYNLSNNLYHLTSTNVFRIEDANGAYVGATEMIIDVTQDEYFGEIFIADRMIPNYDSIVVRNVYGYLLDIPLFNVFGQTPKCVGIEKQTVTIDPGQLSIYNDNLPQTLENGAFATYTDHNGYFFFMMYYGSGITAAFLRAWGANDQVIAKRADTKYYGDIGQVYDNIILPGGDTLDQGLFGSGLIYNNARQGNWSQSLPDEHYYNVLGQAVNNSISGAIDITEVDREVLLLNTNTDYRPKYSTVITGTIKDANGNGICCANAVLAYNSRPAKSQEDGDFEILCFADGIHVIGLNGTPNGSYLPLTIPSTAPVAIRIDRLIFNTGDCFVLFDLVDELTVVINPFGANLTTAPPPYSSTAHFDVGDIIGNILNEILIKAAKRGSRYKLVMRFQDGPGRLCTCVDLATVDIPFPTENGIEGAPIINWLIPLSFKPPKWAHHYQFLRSENLLTANYLQWIVNDVKYVLAENQQGEPIETTFDNFDATQIWINISNISEYFRQHPDSQVGYLPAIGDRIRFIYNEKDVLFPIYNDFEVIGYYTDGQWIKLKYTNDLGEIKTGWRYEIYTKRKLLEDERFFECGECFPTTAPDTDANDFSVRNGAFTWGDTYWVKRNLPIRDLSDVSLITQVIHFMESPMINDFFPSDDEDIGRIGAIDPMFGEIRRSNILRISDGYVTRDNGLSAFRNIDDRKLDMSYGAIRKLAASGFILLAVCENRTVSNYIGRVVVKSNEGETLQALTGQFLGDTRPLQQELGTQNPETIKEFDGYVYGLDARRGVLWRYAGNGQTEISTQAKMRSYFGYYQRNGVWFANAVMDRLYKEYIITIYDKREASGSYGPGNAGLHNVTINKNITDYVKVTDEVYLSYRKNGETKTGYFIVGSLDTVNGGLTYQVGFNLDADANSEVIIYYQGEGKTISFCEPKNKFATRYTFMPEAYGSIDKDIVSIKDGKLWIHDKNAVHNNFYGVQYTSQLKPIFNENASVKLWLAISINAKQSDGKSNWSCPVVTNKNGQLSRVKNNLFKKKEEYFHSEFKFDINTPGGGPNAILNGKNLRSSTLTVLMENDYTGDFDLRSVFVGVEISERNTN